MNANLPLHRCSVPGCGNPYGGTLSRHGRPNRFRLDAYGMPGLRGCQTCYARLRNGVAARSGPKPLERLTPEQSGLAAEGFALAARMARLAARRVWRLDAEIGGAATSGLIRAAATYDAGRGVPFHRWVRRLVRQAINKEVERQFAAFRGLRRTKRLGEFDEPPARPETPPRPALPADFIPATLALLPPRHAEMVRMVVVEGMTLRDAGSRVGVCGERVRQLVKASLARLRDEPEVARHRRETA